MIRFYLLLALFLVSLLCLLKAPEYHLWLLAIAVAEFPLIFAGITALITLTGIWLPKWQLAGTVLGIITILIYLSPILRSYIASKNIRADMTSALGTGVKFPDREPFTFSGLLKSTKIDSYKTLTYVKYQDTALTLDFYGSKILGKRPCVIVVHGGSWSSGDSQQLPDLNGVLSRKGYNVATINYRLAPKYQTPVPVEDVKAAMAYLTQRSEELHIDTNNFVLLGRSAGAQIALLAAYTLHDDRIKGVIDFYGPADMVWGYSIPSNPLIMDSRKVMSDYIGGTYDQVPQKYFNCSPVEFVSKTSCPTLLIHGMNDVLVSPEHCRKLIKKLQANGVKYYWLQLPWATHGFDYNLNGPGGQLSTFAVEAFLGTVAPNR